ncbi:hypothetical predicted transmembrane protein [Leishmania mexicana MHOM/GT/2001/U1103]|uniref:Hypothetical predicted transmembrane protein n=1 Tax=Leishmania mexicana (strain MHOM/GT/2001/U1103) TaxID=929439 RepID=E9AWY4_LEIMU|nr:hypothetical predicted transmembrane protein [Leishmania mexicana MHOM/GT/2001/U1103]CBZ27470.1 hypothetical predicted transmembrane protein [Leishmania mexicana MHOM/GT/2001/U1103]
MPYDTEVQDLLAPALAMGLGPMGGSVYVSPRSSSTDTSALFVCARADVGAMLAPVTVTTVDALFHSITKVSGQLDVNHGCYMANNEDSLPQCVAALTSTAADCGGVAEDAVEPHLRDAASTADRDPTSSSASPGVMPSSAAMLAAYVRDWGQQRLKLERSLRRTREATAAFARVHALVYSAATVPSSKEEARLLRARATARVAEIASAAYDRVMEKYYIFNTWVRPSLGIVLGGSSDGSSSGDGRGPHGAVGPDVAECPVDTYVRLLLQGNESLSAVLLELMSTTLTTADLVRTKVLQPAVRGLECVQVLTALAVMVLEDEPVRTVAAMLATGTLEDTSVWSLDEFAMLAPGYNNDLRKIQIWSLAYAFATVADPAVAHELVGGTDVAACMRRAGLVVPDSITGTVPPSIYWCLYNTSMSEMTQSAVRQRSLATRESAAAAPNGQCLWGLSVWDGLCGGAAFDPARCRDCPPGSVGDGEGHCVCGDASAMYATLTGGCVAKGPAHDTPGVRVIHAGGSNIVPLSGDNAVVALLSVQLPQTAALLDPSAYLRVDVVCNDSGRGGGGTRFVATPSGDRKASCVSVVDYERWQERTGVAHTFDNGTQHFVTYAESLTISVTGTAAFYGETCNLTVAVGSTLHRASRSVTAGTWTFVPGATPLYLTARKSASSSTSSEASSADLLPRCVDALAAFSGPAAPSAVHAGVCRTPDEQLGVFVAPGSYSLFGLSTQQVAGARVRRSAGAAQDAAFTSTVQSLAARTSMEVSLEASGAFAAAVLWSGTLQSRVTPLALNAWRSGWYTNISVDKLQRVRSLRVRFVDMSGTFAFSPVEEVIPLHYEDGEGSGSSDSSSGGSGGSASIADEQYGAGYVAAIVMASVALTALLLLLGALVYLLLITDAWPTKLLL